MASNMSTLGFTFTSEQQFQDAMVSLADRASERLSCPAGDYAIWRSRSGAEIWFHLSPQGSLPGGERGIEGLTPYFEGTQATELVIDDAYRRPGDNAFEGAFSGWVGGDAESGAYPLVFDAVDFSARSDRALPFTSRVRLTGFAREVQAFATEADYHASKTDEPAFAAKAFIPIGLFAAASDESADEVRAPSSQALLTGRVLETRRLDNEETGNGFLWLQVESLDATFDIVADPTIVTGELVAGATVEVLCVMFGRLLD